MKRLVVSVVVGVLVAASCACAASDESTVRVGTLADSRPNAYMENGRITGFDNELLRAVAAKEGLQLEFITTDFSALLDQIKNGQVDIGSAAISETDDRKKIFDFSIAYNYQSLGIVTPDTAAINNQDSLAGKRIGVVQGTVSDTWLSVNQPSALITRFPNDATVLQALLSNRLAGALFDRASAEHYVAEYPTLAVTETFDFVIPQGYAVQKGNGELLRKINDGLRQVIAEGTWVTLHRQFEPNEPVPREFEGDY